MLALFFEVLPRPGHEDHYFRHVGMLKPVLEQHSGMTWLDRFKSLSRDRVILSHQLWKDDAAIVGWREDRQHQGSQTAGRYKHFEDYRIRIAELFLMVEQGGPVEEFEPGPAATGGYVVAGHSTGQPLDGFDESFASVNIADAYVGLSAVASAEHAGNLLARLTDDKDMSWGFAARMTRDYGMFDRDEAPQDYPPVERDGS
ncbi:MAG: antibiotic biosynthesis monooxygenase [Pseudomonadota bacterium]